jgi:putative endonuclease
MRGYTYLLKSVNNNWHYIGSTKDLKERFNQHNSGEVKSTKFYKPFTLAYYESYTDYSLARKREIELKKKGQQKEILFKRLGII